MTPTQQRAISQALNILQVGFFECPNHFYEYFVGNDDWALLMVAAGLNDVRAKPPQVALAVLRHAIAREGFFNGMTDFQPPAHHCSFLRQSIEEGRGPKIELFPCTVGQQGCPHASFENLMGSK